MGHFETEVLTDPCHLDALMDLSGKWIDCVRERKPVREVILDLDSSVSETYGAQEGTAYNGHFGCTCNHPLFGFNQFGNLGRALLREGQVHSADDRHSVPEPVVPAIAMRMSTDSFEATRRSREWTLLKA